MDQTTPSPVSAPNADPPGGTFLVLTATNDSSVPGEQYFSVFPPLMTVAPEQRQTLFPLVSTVTDVGKQPNAVLKWPSPPALALIVVEAGQSVDAATPTIGLDAPSKLAVRAFVRRLNREQGVTVLLTTHDMHDVEALAERVIVISQGRLLADGPFESLRAGVLAERRLYIDFAGPAPELEIQGVTVRARTDHSLELAFDPSKIPTPKLIAAIATEHAVEDIHVDEPAIEEVITRFYDLHDAHEA